MNWYDIKNKKENADVYIYGEIGYEVDAKDFIDEIKALDGKPFNLHINSVGGFVFEGQAIYTTIQNYKGKVTAYIEGVAASMASIIALAADEVHMSENSLYMIHDPIVGVYGNKAELNKKIELLNIIKEQMVNIYTKKTGLEASQVIDLMSAETWFNAEEAKEAGFVDVVMEAVKVAATYDLSAYKNMTQEKMLSTIKLINNKSKMEELKTWFEAKLEEVVAKFQNTKSETTEKEVVVNIADESDVKNKLDELSNTIAEKDETINSANAKIEELTASLEEANKELAKYTATQTEVNNEVDPTPAPAEKKVDAWTTFAQELIG